MLDADDHDLSHVVVDPVQHAVDAAAGGEDLGQFSVQRLADALRILHQSGGQKVDDGNGDGFR